MNSETLQKYSCLLQNYLVSEGMEVTWAIFLNVIVNCIIVGFAVLLLDVVFRKFIIETFKAFSNKTKTTFDDYLVKSNFPRFVAHILPLAVVWHLIPIVFFESPLVTNLIQIIAQVYLAILFVLIFRSILRTTRNFLSEKERYKDKPMESYVQVMMIFAWGIGIFWIIQLLTGFSLISLTTLGAASAVILLIFKDTILGFVASI